MLHDAKRRKHVRMIAWRASRTEVRLAPSFPLANESAPMIFLKAPHAHRILLLALAMPWSVVAGEPVPVVAAQAVTDMRQAVESAWQHSLGARAAGAQREASIARREAAASWTPEPPALTLSQRSDRLNRNDGMREFEAELEVPLGMPGPRSAAVALAEAESSALDAGLGLARLKLAGEVREAVWSLLLARNELQANERRVAEAEVLAADVERRVGAGDLARVDANGARGAVLQARAALAEATARVQREQRLYTALTGLPHPPADTETGATSQDIDRHPALQGSRRAADVARARLHQASTATRDAPELVLGVTRERDESRARYANTTTLGVRIPFGSETRNRPRISAANAELVEAEIATLRERERMLAEAEAAHDALRQAQRIETLAAERARLAADTRQLLARAFELGEVDLPARLRAENEHFDAGLALGRARLEAGRAVSRLQQAWGLLP